MGIFGSSSRKEINWINTIKGGKMSTGHSAPVMLKTMLFLLLLKGVISNNDEIKCQRNLQLAEKALADVYVVDRSSDIARAFYRYATCWLGTKRVKDIWDDEQYSASHIIEIVIGDVELAKAIKPSRSIRVSALHRCDAWNTACLNEPKVEDLPGHARIIHTHPSDFRYASQLLIAGKYERNETQEHGGEYASELARLYHSQALRMGGIVVLVLIFILFTCGVCCHSTYTIAILHDDIGWRREQLVNRNDEDLFRIVPPEDGAATPPPLRSPAPGLQTAMSRSRTSLSSFGTDETQASRSVKSGSLISLE